MSAKSIVPTPRASKSVASARSSVSKNADNAVLERLDPLTASVRSTPKTLSRRSSRKTVSINAPVDNLGASTASLKIDLDEEGLSAEKIEAENDTIKNALVDFIKSEFGITALDKPEQQNLANALDVLADRVRHHFVTRWSDERQKSQQAATKSLENALRSLSEKDRAAIVKLAKGVRPLDVGASLETHTLTWFTPTSRFSEALTTWISDNITTYQNSGGKEDPGLTWIVASDALTPLVATYGETIPTVALYRTDPDLYRNASQLEEKIFNLYADAAEALIAKMEEENREHVLQSNTPAIGIVVHSMSTPSTTTLYEYAPSSERTQKWIKRDKQEGLKVYAALGHKWSMSAENANNA